MYGAFKRDRFLLLARRMQQFNALRTGNKSIRDKTKGTEY